jgi:hypothetical protein
MIASGEEGVGPLGLEVWKKIRMGGDCFLDLSNMRRKTGLRLSFGMICGVGIIP